MIGDYSGLRDIKGVPGVLQTSSRKIDGGALLAGDHHVVVHVVVGHSILMSFRRQGSLDAVSRRRKNGKDQGEEQ